MQPEQVVTPFHTTAARPSARSREQVIAAGARRRLSIDPAIVALVAAVQVASAGTINWQLVGDRRAWRYLGLAAVSELVVVPAFIQSLWSDTVDWRGRQVRVHRDFRGAVKVRVTSRQVGLILGTDPLPDRILPAHRPVPAASTPPATAYWCDLNRVG